MTLDAQSLNLNARQILLKRLSTAQALAYTGPLGEVVIDTNLKLLRIQDGVTPGGVLMATSANIAHLQSQINSILNNIDPAALDSLSEVVANVNALLANNIESQLVNSGFYANLSNTGNLTIDGSLLPKTHLAQDLGSPTLAWRDLYISNATAYFGNAAVTVTSNGLTVSMAGNVLPVIANVRFPDGSVQRTAVDMAVLANIYTLLTPNVSANLTTIHTDVTNAISYFGNLTDAAVSTLQANLQAQINYIKNNTDPATLDSLTEIVASFQNIDANIVSNIATLTNTVANLVATQNRLTSGNAQVILNTSGPEPYVLFPAASTGGQVQISEAELSSIAGNLALTSSQDAFVISNGDGSVPGGSKLWKFDRTGNLVLPQTAMNVSPAPISLPGITFTDSTFQTTAYVGSADKVDITNTNGLTTTYYPTFVESRTNGQYMRADVDLTYRTDDNLLRSGNIQVGRNIYGSALGGISNAIQLRPNIDIDKRFLFTVDSSGGNYIRSGMEMPMAEVDKAVTLAFPHDNSTAGYIFNQGTDTNGTEWNDALVIFQNGGNVKIGTITGVNGNKVWEFNQTGNLILPQTNMNASPAPVSLPGITWTDGTFQTGRTIKVPQNQNFRIETNVPVGGVGNVEINQTRIKTSGLGFLVEVGNGNYYYFNGQVKRFSHSESNGYIAFGTETRDQTGHFNDIEIKSYGDGTNGNVYITAGTNPTSTRWAFQQSGTIRFPDTTIQETAYIATSEQKFDIKAISFAAASNTRYGVNTASGAVTATLPASPSLGDAVFFADAGGAMSTNALTVARNGNTIMGSAADIVVNTNGDSLGLFWNGTTWRLYE
jgi:hypothetical protein